MLIEIQPVSTWFVTIDGIRHMRQVNRNNVPMWYRFVGAGWEIIGSPARKTLEDIYYKAVMQRAHKEGG